MLKYPTHKQKSEIAKELGLEPKQVNWWFTYKRGQVKVTYIFWFEQNLHSNLFTGH